MLTTLLKTLYKAFVLPYLTYCCCVWHFCSKTVSDHLQRVQNYAMRVILKKPPRTSSCTCLQSLGWRTVYQHRCLLLLCQVKRCLLKISPSYLTSMFMTNEQFGYTSTRGRDKIHMLQPRTEFGRRTFSFKGAQIYNILPSTAVRLRPSLRLTISVFPTVYQSVSLVLLFVILVNCFCNFVFVIVICIYYVLVIVISI